MPDREYYLQKLREMAEGGERVVYRSAGFAYKEATSLPRRWRNLGDWLNTHEVFGQKAGDFLVDFMIGAAVGASARAIAQPIFLQLGVNTPELTSAYSGAFAGFLKSVIFDIRKQQREFGHIESRRRVVVSALRGIVMGGVGGYVGKEISDQISDHFLHHPADTIHRPSAPKPLPTPTHEATPTPSHTPTGAPTASPPEAAPTQSPPAVSPSETPSVAHPIPGHEIDPGTAPAAPLVPSPESVVPHPADAFYLEQDSTVWGHMNDYLTQQLGRPPSVDELKHASSLVLQENHILNDRTIPAGAILKIDSVNSYVNQILMEHLAIEDKLAHLPNLFYLHQGSFPYMETHDYLLNLLGREPTADEILAVTREVCRQSNIDAPSIGVRIPGGLLETKLGPNTVLAFNSAVKETIKSKVLSAAGR